MLGVEPALRSLRKRSFAQYRLSCLSLSASAETESYKALPLGIARRESDSANGSGQLDKVIEKKHFSIDI
jgi:hypothetical protein